MKNLNEDKLINIVSVALGIFLTFVFVNVFPLYSNISNTQSWFASILFGIVVAWSMIEFIPPMLADKNDIVEINVPSQLKKIANMGVNAGDAPMQLADSSHNQQAADFKSAIVRAWNVGINPIKNQHHANFSFLPAVVGPLTVSVPIKLHWPLATVKKMILSGLREPLSAFTNVSEKDIGINIDKGIVWIDFPSLSPYTPDGPELAKITPPPIPLDDRTEDDRKDIFATVGLNRKYDPIHLDLAKFPTVGFFGPSGRGKTSALITALYTICAKTTPERFQFVVMAEKLETWQPWLQSPFCSGIYTDAESINSAMFNLINGEFEDRRIDEWNDRPSIVVIVDDLADVSHSKEFSKMISKISTSGRSTRIYLWVSTQAGGSNQGLGDMIISSNMMFRVVFSTADPGEAYRAAGVKSFDFSLSDNLGDAYIVVNGRPIRAATGFTKKADILALWEGANCGPGVHNPLPPEKWANSTEKWAKSWANDGPSGLLSGPSNGLPKNVGNRDLTDGECITIFQNLKGNGGDFSKRQMMLNLWDDDNTTCKRKLKVIIERAEQLLEVNDDDIWDQISDIDTDVLGDKNE